MKLSAVTFATTLIFPFVAMPALAEPRAMSAEQIQAFRNAGSTIFVRTKNLIQVADSLQSAEQGPVVAILGDTTTALDDVDKILTLAVIYNEMETANDKSVARKALAATLRKSQGPLNASIEQINTMLAYIRTPAALSEAQQIRDQLQAVRRDLEQYSD